LKVTGDIFRPGLEDQDLILDQWSRYRGIYLDDGLARARVEDLARQSMKVCVGDRTFDNNIIGTSRDALRACIDTEVNELVAELGLRVENLVIPDVILSEAVQVALDAIVQSRLETEKAAQDQLRAKAEAGAEQAKQEGQIRVEQSRIQEQARQGILLAQLEQEQLAAQLAVIEQQKQNDLANVGKQQAVTLAERERDLLVAQQDLEIARITTERAIVDAEARTAVEQVLAILYEANPEYLTLLLAQANASALNETDKVIFTPEGTVPNLVLSGPGIVPTVDTTPNTAPTTPTETTP
jgi:Arc/MetJ family transcription regulator